MDFARLNFLDLLIAIFIVVSVLRGARAGFLAGVFSLAGVVIGASVGSRIAPSLLPDGGKALYGAGIPLGSILAFSILGGVTARTIGGSIRDRLSDPSSGTLDGLGGGLLGLALSLVVVWAVGFALQSVPIAGLHPAVEHSQILQSLNKRMPSGPLTQAVADMQPLQRVHGPESDVAAPEGNIVDDPDVRAASEHTVRITGEACGYGVEGSGWVAGRDLVVTNAHVVAGETATLVQIGGSGRDLPAAVIGFPENGPLNIKPARTRATQRVFSSDAYDRGPVERVVTEFRVYVRPGNSGGPAVDADGRVVATIFASRTDSDNSGYGVPSSIVQRHIRVAASRTTPV